MNSKHTKNTEVNSSELQFQHIPLADITPDPNQPRKFYEEQAMLELRESVRESGVLQPILVREKP
jgi:ParB family chromosome partitioning protein